MQACFTDYPRPMTTADIARRLEHGESRWRVVRDQAGIVVAAACAELDLERASAELTDCATRSEFRGRGLMGFLARELTSELQPEFRLYSLARAGEPGINCILRKLGFLFTGRLVNDCRMPTGWESVNVWCHP
jgi:hypothetical protein